jgi:monofunctional biosynthetic peptidoglycan transglycosylase
MKKGFEKRIENTETYLICKAFGSLRKLGYLPVTQGEYMIRFLVSLSIISACVVGLIGVLVAAFFLTTPRPTDIRGCITTQLYKVRLCPSDPSYAKLREISPNLKHAILASEDSSFYHHNGIDWFELKESMSKNWEKGAWARGGSTITQQLAKNVYLSAEKSLLRKAREALITVQLERMLSKDEILEKYLNVIEFGENIYGVRKAAQHYFGKGPSQLNAAESAFLAFLLPSPKKYSVSFKKKQLTPFALSQTRIIVNRLFKFQKISEGEKTEALYKLAYLFGGASAPLPTASDESILPSAEEMPAEDEEVPEILQGLPDVPASGELDASET